MASDDYLSFVTKLVAVLENNAILYAIGGSLASSAYGEYRLTYDIDLSLHLEPEQVDSFVKSIESLGWYISPESVQKAVIRGGDFQLIDGSTALKADCYISNSERQYRALTRGRSLPYDPSGKQARFMAPEDVILYKLEWYGMGKSEKHLRDISAMLNRDGIQIDREYISRHVDEVNGRETWEKILKKAEDDSPKNV